MFQEWQKVLERYFTMAGDEILMGKTSALGPIDAQVVSNGKRFSADAFLDGLEKIKSEVSRTGKLNPTYIPMLQNISPGEIQHFENAQNFSKTLVKNWLSRFKFKNWDTHSSSGGKVTLKNKEKRADEIAKALCKHSDWLTHGRSIRISDLQRMKLEIIDYSTEEDLNDAIERYFTLLRITFDLTGIYKIFETCNSQIYQSISQVTQQNIPLKEKNLKAEAAHADYTCPKCGTKYEIQLNLIKGARLKKNSTPFPKNDIFTCKNCKTQSDLKPMRMQLEAQTGLKVVL